MKTRSHFAVILRILLFTTLIGVLLAGIVIAIQRPISGRTHSFEALFTDASGLKTNADVRMFGVAVGKLTAIDLDGTNAKVRFTVNQDRAVFETSTFAIRYQNLIGQRYIDIKQPDATGPILKPDTMIGTERTIPSFDITTLFNGLEPVLKEFSPDALDQFMQNAIAVIEGDGTAIGATLDAIGTLSDYVSDRQSVISALLRNFRSVSEQLGGKSPETATLIRGISEVFVSLQAQFDGLIDFINVAPSVLGPLNSLLAAVGLTRPDNPDVQTDLRLLFPDPETAVDVLNKLPGLLQSLTVLLPDPNTDIDTTCSSGAAELPGVLSVLIAGQRISVCNG